MTHLKRLSCAAAVVAALGVPAGMALAEVVATIGQKGKSFSEKEVTVSPGDTVRFQNDDERAHNIMVTEGKSFNGGLQVPGDHTDITFDEPGDYTIGCAIHPTMEMVVHVK
jgi:plastocyanin